MYKLEIKIDRLPQSLNKGLRNNRYAYHQKNTNWDLHIFSLVRNNLPPAPLEKAVITIIRHSNRMLDYDGLVGSMKPVVDALVTAGVLIDDRWGVTGKWNVDQQFRPKKDGPLLEIFIEQQV